MINQGGAKASPFYLLKLAKNLQSCKISCNFYKQSCMKT